jgi:UPF0755 protein
VEESDVTQLQQFLSNEPLPPSHNRRAPGRLIAIIALLVVVVGALGATFLLLQRVGDVQDYPGPGSGEASVVVVRGDSLRQIGGRLVEADVVQSLEAFLDAAANEPRAESIGPGRYTLRRQMSGVGALALMLDPQSRVESRLVLPEGLRLEETVELASAATDIPADDFTKALENADDLRLPRWADGRPQGFMFPATYDLAGDETAVQVLDTLLARFDQASSTVDLVNRAEDVGLTPYEVVIVASLLEAEAKPGDFAKVARVIYNRLDQGMPLQLDSTVGYALGVDDLTLSAEQLEFDSPYNTYRYPGLPPRPINSPGEAALEAALAPAKGKWLYFVTVNPETGETKFAKSYERFLDLKREFQDYLANQGATS